MSRHLRRGFCLFVLLFVAGVGPFAGKQTAYAAKSQPDVARVELDGTVLTVHFQGAINAKPRQAVLDWIKRSARAVSVYYGRFPLRTVDIVINPFAGRGVTGGRAFGGQQPQIIITVGVDSTHDDYKRDWIIVHEMIHMAFPMLDDRHDWMTEGLAVYVESIARLQAGDLNEAEVWKGFVDGMKRGLPRSGDKGLDHTPTWGRTYWGGAIFCLWADLEIRKRTSGKRSLQDALKAVIAAGGDHRTRWPLIKALEIADKATGTTAITDLYNAWRATPVDPGLNKLWQRLGVKDLGRTVAFDNSASLAKTRRKIGARVDH